MRTPSTSESDTIRMLYCINYSIREKYMYSKLVTCTSLIISCINSIHP